MSTIPPLPHLESPLDQYAKLAQLRSQRNEQQLQQQQIIGSQQENQIRAQQLRDQQAMTAAMHEWDGKDFNILPGLVLKHGASAQTVMGLKTGIVKQQTDLADLAIKQQQGVSDQFKNQQIQNDWMAQRVADIKSLPAEQQPQAFEKMKTDAMQRGYLSQQEAQQFQYQGPEQLALTEKGLLGHASALEAAQKQAEIERTRSQQALADAQKKKLDQEMDAVNPADPHIQEQKYQRILQQYQGKQPVSAADALWAKSYEASKRETSTASDSLGVTTSTTKGPSGLSAAQGYATVGGRGGSSAQSTKDSIVDLIGQYRENPTMIQRLQVKHPEIMSAVLQKYPDFDQTTYNAKNKLIQGYTSGTQSKEIGAINTAMGHIKNLDDAIDALHNGDLTLLNKIGKAYNINVGGKTAEAAFQLIVHRVGPEIAGAYVPSGGGIAERIADEKDFDVNLPPQTLHNNAAITVNMLRSKIGSLENQYKNTVGRDDFTQRFITPEAQASLQKMAPRGNGGGGQMPSPQTAAPNVGDVKQYQGSNYRFDGTKWVRQ